MAVSASANSDKPHKMRGLDMTTLEVLSELRPRMRERVGRPPQGSWLYEGEEPRGPLQAVSGWGCTPRPPRASAPLTLSPLFSVPEVWLSGPPEQPGTIKSPRPLARPASGVQSGVHDPFIQVRRIILPRALPQLCPRPAVPGEGHRGQGWPLNILSQLRPCKRLWEASDGGPACSACLSTGPPVCSPPAPLLEVPQLLFPLGRPCRAPGSRSEDPEPGGGLASAL